MDSKQKFYNDFEGGQYNGDTKTIQIDSIGYGSITIYNTSLAGTIFVLPSTQLQPGEFLTIQGQELEINKGKIEIMLTNFFANIEYGYAVIKKRFI